MVNKIDVQCQESVLYCYFIEQKFHMTIILTKLSGPNEDIKFHVIEICFRYLITSLLGNWKQASQFLIYVQIMTTTGKLFQVQLFHCCKMCLKMLVSGIVTKRTKAKIRRKV